MPDAPATWTVRNPTHTRTGTRSRVAAEVNDVPIWFDAEDVELEPYAEAFVAPLLLPALRAGASIRVEAPVDARWIEQMRQVTAIYTDWWGTPDALPLLPTETTERAPGRASGVAQCFTGGVDSFYTLLREDHGVDTLLFVHGYDVMLFDRERSRRIHEAFGAVAEARGLRTVHLRSNLREHPDARQVHWAYTHGAGLAAAGCAASAALGRLVIPSSYAYERGRPWGTHWETDALWSLPERLGVVHGDAPARFDKVAAIVDEPLVHRHLRVCWKNIDQHWNCSQCEKCVRTMVTISTVGDLSRFEVFDQSVPLPQRIDRMRPLTHHIVGVWAEEADRHPDAAVRAAIHRLLERTPGAPKPEA